MLLLTGFVWFLIERKWFVCFTADGGLLEQQHLSEEREQPVGAALKFLI